MPLIIGITICYLGPMAFGVYCYLKNKKKLKIMIAGALGFIVFSGLLREYLIIGSIEKEWYSLKSSNPFLWILIASLSAGIFEECGRYITWKVIIKVTPKWEDAIIFGFFHAAAEAMTSVGALVLFHSAKMWQANHSIEAYLFSLDRVPAYPVHIGLSTLVLYSIGISKRKGLYYSVLLHCAINIGLAFLSIIIKVHTLTHYLCSLLCGVICMFITLNLKNKFINS